MAQTMTPSARPMTDGQIESVVSKVRAALQKRRAELSTDAAQRVLGIRNIGMILADPFCKRAKLLTDVVTRQVSVIRTRSPQQMINDAHCRQSVMKDSVATMPRGQGDDVEVYFFQISPRIKHLDLAEEYRFRGLMPDPYAQAAVNEHDRLFAAVYPNISCWKDISGEWHFLSFCRYGDVPSVCCSTCRYSAPPRQMWFAGVPRKTHHT